MQTLLGDVTFSKKSFANLTTVLEGFEKKEFLSLVDRKRSHEINLALLRLIQAEPEPCFLLAAVLEFIERVGKAKLLEHYVFNSFELWLNQNSQLSFEENYRVRAKIAGKYVDRGDYTALFPIGFGKVYPGPHFVLAHKSPDLDTTVASFWGWLDAFAARVSDGVHMWNVPGGPPASQIEIDLIFRDIFGPAVFTHLVKTRSILHVTGSDLMSQKGLVLKQLTDQIGSIDHDRDQIAAVLVDAQGFYLGDWRSADVEGVRDVILLLSSCIRWFENRLNVRFLEIFAKKDLNLTQVSSLLTSLYTLPISAAEPAQEFTKLQTKKVAEFLKRVLHVSGELEITFDELFKDLRSEQFNGLEQTLAAMQQAQLFDAKGNLIEDRSRIFTYLEQAIGSINQAVFELRTRLERLDIALKTKSEVFNHLPTYVSVRSDLDEIKAKMGSHPSLTVNYPDRDQLYPVGVIRAEDIRKSILGTVSLRDFCNRDEMGIPAYLEVISVIDHHKSSLSTSTPPFAIISDAQSSNTLVAKQAFTINDANSLGGMNEQTIQAQLAEEMGKKEACSNRLLQKLLHRRMVAKSKSSFFIHPEREFVEYLHFLYAILEDTDLLTKVTPVDVDCVVELLNRLKSLSLAREAEIVTISDIPRDAKFAKKAAARILQNEDLYSLYRKVYDFREKEVELNMQLASEAKPSNFFADTKEQNGRCRIGQTKLFENNVAFLEKKAAAIRHHWVQVAQEVYRKKAEISLHIHMMSTIVSAGDVYKGVAPKHVHKDELWLWIPKEDELAIENLKTFLTGFQTCPGLKNNPLEVEFVGDQNKELERIFKESFLSIPSKKSGSQQADYAIVILRYNPGSLNSRKAMIAPYLPF